MTKVTYICFERISSVYTFFEVTSAVDCYRRRNYNYQSRIIKTVTIFLLSKTVSHYPNYSGM